VQFTWADLILFTSVAYLEREGAKDVLATHAPALLAIRDQVAQRPNIAKYLAARA
jgi:hypothetical protein